MANRSATSYWIRMKLQFGHFAQFIFVHSFFSVDSDFFILTTYINCKLKALFCMLAALCIIFLLKDVTLTSDKVWGRVFYFIFILLFYFFLFSLFPSRLQPYLYFNLTCVLELKWIYVYLYTLT